MKKKTMRIISLALILIIALSALTTVFASAVASGDATMVLVSEEIASGTFGEKNYGSYEKKKVDFDSTNKTIDIQLTVKNNAPKPGTHEEQVTETGTKIETVTVEKTRTETVTNTKEIPGEVVFLIDISNSMSSNTVTLSDGTTSTRKQLVVSAARKLTEELFDLNKDIKMGVVEYSTTTQISNPDNRGTSDDAVIVTKTLTNSETEINTALDTVLDTVRGTTTDIQMGLRAAASLFSSDTSSKKYLILLTDGIPNVAEGVVPTTDTENGGWKSAYDYDVFDPTKEELLATAKAGINPVSVLINMTDDELPISTISPKPTYKEVAQYIFGTEAKPTAGSVYYIDDDNITKTITDTIYEDLKPETTTTEVEVPYTETQEVEVPTTTTKTVTVNDDPYVLEDIVLKDYFPDNIVKNFKYAELVSASKGTITAKIDTSDNSITWTIGDLQPQESATFTYRLKLNDSFDSSIVGINLPTNEKITIDYKENKKQADTVTDKRGPVVALDVPATKKIPQTGDLSSPTVDKIAKIFIIVGTIMVVSSGAVLVINRK